MKGQGSRDRMRAALERRGDTGPLLDLGSTSNTTMSRIAHNRLLAFLELPAVTTPQLMSLPFQAVQVHEAILEALHIDTRPIFLDQSAVSPIRPDGTYEDGWGICYRPVTLSGQTAYYEMVTHPLQNAKTPQDVEDYAWPLPIADSTWRPLGKRAATLARDTEYALVGHPGDTSLFEVAWGMLGMERFLMALVREKDLVHALLERILDVQVRRMGGFLSHVGAHLDVISVGDDLGQQGGLLLSPASYRELIKPYHRRLFSSIKARTGAKLHFHSCGGIAPLIPDLIELGVDVINPVQVSAKGMSPSDLAERFGRQISFWGGVDTQDLLRTGRITEVQHQVRELVRTLGRHGGYVLGAVHNVQPDIPPENVVAMYDEAWRASKS
jgi:uroporphyrinogen decarboxylase